MELRLDSLKIKAIANVLEKGLPTKAIAETQNFVNFKVDGNGNLLISVTDGNIFATAIITKDNFSTDATDKNIEFALNGKLFFDLCKKAYSDLRIVFRDGSDRVKISFDGVNATLSLANINPSAFYQGAEDDRAKPISLPLSAILNGYNKVGVATNKTMARPTLSGIACLCDTDKVEYVACDGYRLHRYFFKLDKNFDNDKTAILPPKLFSLLQGIGDGDCTAEYTISRNSIRVKVLNFEIVSALIQGEYFNYKMIIPKTFGSEVDVNVSELKRAVDLVSLSSSNEILIDMQPSSLWIVSANLEARIEQEIKCNLVGNPVQVRIDTRFFGAAIKAIGSETVKIRANTAESPLTITEIGENFETLYLLIPRINIK